jgi:hypothetical protein
MVERFVPMALDIDTFYKLLSLSQRIFGEEYP